MAKQKKVLGIKEITAISHSLALVKGAYGMDMALKLAANVLKEAEYYVVLEKAWTLLTAPETSGLSGFNARTPDDAQSQILPRPEAIRLCLAYYPWHVINHADAVENPRMRYTVEYLLPLAKNGIFKPESAMGKAVNQPHQRTDIYLSKILAANIADHLDEVSGCAFKSPALGLGKFRSAIRKMVKAPRVKPASMERV